MNLEIADGPQQNNRLITVAKDYLKQGWSVIPVQAHGKVPLIDWKPFTQRKATEIEITEWFKKEVNIGVVTGQISNLIIIDLDGQEGLDEANKLGLKSSVTVITGKGRHLYYKWQPNIKNAVRIRPGIDIRSDNGFVVMPGSISESGKRYRFLNPVLVVASLPVFPDALCALEAPKNTNGFKEEGWIAKALEEMKDGNIDNTLTRVLGRLRHDGYSKQDARILLEPHALEAGAEEGHLEEKIENIWGRYESAKSTIKSSNGMDNQRPRLSTESCGLVIHSPTNPDSLKQFNQFQSILDYNKSAKLKTGYPKLDQMLQGGLKSSRLMVIAARTGTGKTNMLLGITRSLCLAGKSVLLFSTEMPYEQIWQRYIAALEDPKDFNQHKFYICDSFAPNIEKVEEAINEIKPDVFMFDHINHVSEEQRELGTFMQGLNFLRRKYDCAGIVTAQLNRSADWIDLKSGEKTTPRMSMIKGSGTIEQASSRVLLLSETRVTPEMTEIVGNLDKNDNGPKGLIHFGLMNKPYKMIEL